MVSIPMISSCLLLLALLLLSAPVVNGRSTSPWRSGMLGRRPSSNSDTSNLFLPPILNTVRDLRGGDSSFGTGATRLNTALPTPETARISSSVSSSPTEMNIAGGHIGTKTAKIVEPTEIVAASTTPRAGALKSSASGSNTTATSTAVAATTTIKEKALTPAAQARKEKKESKKRHKEIAKKLKNRNATNKRRKFMHAAWGMLFASLNHMVPRHLFLPGMAVVTGTTLAVELLRYRKGFEWMNDLMHVILGKALRKNEMDGKFTGSLYYFSGVTLTAYLFPKPCATLGICQLAIADPTASYFGRATRHVYWSRINNGFFGLGRNKGILGFLGGALSCVPLNYRLLSLATMGTKKLAKSTVWSISLALGLAGALADLMVPTPALTLPKTVFGFNVPPFHLDDNIVVPILSGWACVKIFQAASIVPAELALAKYLVA